MYVLVKFRGHPVPRIFVTEHRDDCYALATMRGVEWASHPITENGNVLPRKEYIGRSLIGEEKIVPILPEDGHQHLRRVEEMRAKGTRPAEEGDINKVVKGSTDYTMYDQPGPDEQETGLHRQSNHP